MIRTGARQIERCGAGVIAELEELLAGLDFQSVFLVTGQKSFAQEPLQTALKPLLGRYPHQRFCEFSRNPKLSDLQSGIAAVRTMTSPLVLAVGGGSALDMAKLIAFFAPKGCDPRTYLTTGPSGDDAATLPLATIPTTAGTGSEATQFATVYINQTKYSLDNPAILPQAVILDPALTFHLPAKETAESGLDALTQAIESYWNVKSTDDSKAYAREAIPLLWENLETTVLHPSLESRTAMLKGANLAGKAICITRTTAAHAISYPMTAHFNVPHGQAVSISLPYFLAFNRDVSIKDCLDPRGPQYVKKTIDEILVMLGCSSVDEARRQWTTLMQRIGAKTTLAELGISRDDRELIIKDGFNPQRVRNNPRELTESTLRDLLDAFGG